MIPSPEELSLNADARRESAKRDLQDIAKLLNCEGYQRWFLRRLTDKRNEAHEGLLHKEGITAEQREVFRQRVLIFDEIMQLAERDRALAMRDLEG